MAEARRRQRDHAVAQGMYDNDDDDDEDESFDPPPVLHVVDTAASIFASSPR